MARLGGNTRHTPGPGDLTRTGDPQNETPGECEECEGNHPVSRCPAVARHHLTAERRRRQNSKDAA